MRPSGDPLPPWVGGRGRRSGSEIHTLVLTQSGNEFQPVGLGGTHQPLYGDDVSPPVGRSIERRRVRTLSQIGPKVPENLIMPQHFPELSRGAESGPRVLPLGICCFVPCDPRRGRESRLRRTIGPKPLWRMLGGVPSSAKQFRANILPVTSGVLLGGRSYPRADPSPTINSIIHHSNYFVNSLLQKLCYSN